MLLRRGLKVGHCANSILFAAVDLGGVTLLARLRILQRGREREGGNHLYFSFSLFALETRYSVSVG